MVYVLFVLGFVILIYGADRLVEGASSIAKTLQVSDLVIGLTIVALGTSAPELVVSVTAGLKQSTDLAIGNILGSNIFNTLVILGTAAMLCPVDVQRNTVWKEIPMSLLAALVLGICANDAIINSSGTQSAITRTDGLILLAFFIIFMYYVTDSARNNPESADEEFKKLPLWKAILFVAGGMIGLILGGQWIVEGAIEIARLFNLSESVIGLTVVAAGTSLPELATSAVAAYKRNSDIAIGNVVGSNIFNVFLILGVTSTITPVSFDPALNRDVFINILASLLMFLFLFTGKGRRIDRKEGALFVLIYLAYLSYLLYNLKS